MRSVPILLIGVILLAGCAGNGLESCDHIVIEKVSMATETYAQERTETYCVREAQP